MYKITFIYYFRDSKDRTLPKGCPQKAIVYGETIADLNKNVLKRKENHDVFKYLPYIFDKIEEC